MDEDGRDSESLNVALEKLSEEKVGRYINISRPENNAYVI